MNTDQNLYQLLFQNEMLFQVAESNLNTSPISREVKKDTEIEKMPVKLQEASKQKASMVTGTFPDLQYRVLVLIDNPRKEYLEGEQRILLDNILKAIGLGIDQVDVINISFLDNSDANILFTERKINYLITFGVPLIRLQIDLLLPPYMPEQVEGIWLLLADTLTKVESDREVKKRLWQALKRMFQ